MLIYKLSRQNGSDVGLQVTTHPPIAIVMITCYKQPNKYYPLWVSGPHGFVPKTRPLSEGLLAPAYIHAQWTAQERCGTSSHNTPPIANRADNVL